GLRLARPRLHAGERDPPARLSVGPGWRTVGRRGVRVDQPDHRHALPLPGSTAAHFVKRPLLLLGVALVAAVVLVAILAPVLPLRDPNITAPARRLGQPGAAGYVLGTDQLGRDLLSRLVWGARVSIVVATVAAGVA